MSHCELTVRGHLATSVIELIRTRFDGVTTRPGTARTTGPSTILVVAGIDPAAERALLTLLWDSGHDVISMHSTRWRSMS
ncbi:hypothetical protein GCM10009744_45670 [Kribbella alba]|uniref:Uncharacterized protein n=1 Tax=Kribbella alba TaxID=190197 RepID=A0ABN2FIX5_9ACTN